MVAKAALKLVPATRFFREEISSWSSPKERTVKSRHAVEDEAHSLHYAISYRESFDPNLPAFFIERYSRRGGVVLDPFCGSGTTLFESALRGRLALGVDNNPLATAIARAKLSPADITEVTLALQRVNLRRPIDLKHFREFFAPFYEIETFREIVNLRSFLLQSEDRIAKFMQLIALSLLHGHSAGFFSVYTFPQISLTPSEQASLNMKRSQVADYRAVIPRVLRRTASVLRDGVPSILRTIGLLSSVDASPPFRTHQVFQGDARSLDQIPSECIDLIVSAPPLPATEHRLGEQWLRRWFMGSTVAEALGPTPATTDAPHGVASWREFMNGSLLEFARVVKPKGRVVLDLPEYRSGRTRVSLVDSLLEEVTHGLSRYWEAEGVFDYRNRSVRVELANKAAREEALLSGDRNGVLVLRRR